MTRRAGIGPHSPTTINVSDAISEEYAMSTAVKARPKIKIHPLEDRVVILPAEEAETMRGPLYIPDTAKEKPTQGEVLAVGPGRIEKGERVKFDIEVGDTVLYGKYTGMPYQMGDDELIIIKATDVLAKIG
jgi:chaperonin GroES